MRTLCLLLICCFSTAAITPATAQQVETMHIHFDKDTYLPGETIWFKCYTYFNNKPSALSSNLFIGFYNQDGMILTEKRYPLIEGTANGEYKIPADSGYTAVIARAFTKAMWLQDSSHVYERTLYIKTNPDSLVKNEPNSVLKTSLQFFPEGGQWVAGLYSYLAFKAWQKDGSPAIAHGKIINDKGAVVVDSFATNEMGLGRLQILPEIGVQYKASWQDGDGRQHESVLPEVKPLGAVLHTEQTDKEVFYSVLKNTDAANFDTLHLRASIHGNIIYEAALPMKGLTQAVNKFPTDSIPAGLLLVTLMDSRWNPLQEKLVYIKPAQAADDPIINFTQISTGPKAKNELNIIVPDTLFTNMSLSIADVTFYNHDQPGIKEDLLVAGELKALWPGVALKPIMQQYPELVTATHGWRSYQWPASPTTGAIQPVDNYIALGVDYKEKNFALRKNAALTLMIKDPQTGNQFYKLTQQTQTHYGIDGLVFYDSAKIYYQVEGYPETLPYLVLNGDGTPMQAPLATGATTNINRQPVPLNIDAASTAAGPGFDWINSTPADTGSVKTKTLKEVKLNTRMVNPVTRRMQELEDKYAKGLFRGTSKGYQINVLDDPNAEMSVDIYSYIFGKIPGLRIGSSLGGRSLQAINHFENNPFNAWQDVMVFIDEVQWEPSGLGNLNMNNVAYIKFVPGIVIQSVGNGNNGALYVYTKRGDEESGNASNMKTNIIKGYSSAKQFFNPVYDTETSKTTPDLRSTLYWEPYVITDKTNHKVNISFYNNDVSKKLLLTLKGFNEEGKLIEVQRIIE